MIKKELMENIIEKQKKYADLLWYARSSEKHNSIPGVIENRERIEGLYPEEVNDLQNEDGDWHHGFNSGMVAALRYILTMDDLGLEQANEEFPMLDS
jgi:hypothetical protein